MTTTPTSETCPARELSGPIRSRTRCKAFLDALIGSTHTPMLVPFRLTTTDHGRLCQRNHRRRRSPGHPRGAPLKIKGRKKGSRSKEAKKSRAFAKIKILEKRRRNLTARRYRRPRRELGAWAGRDRSRTADPPGQSVADAGDTIDRFINTPFAVPTELTCN